MLSAGQWSGTTRVQQAVAADDLPSSRLHATIHEVDEGVSSIATSGSRNLCTTESGRGQATTQGSRSGLSLVLDDASPPPLAQPHPNSSDPAASQLRPQRFGELSGQQALLFRSIQTQPPIAEEEANHDEGGVAAAAAGGGSVDGPASAPALSGAGHAMLPDSLERASEEAACTAAGAAAASSKRGLLGEVGPGSSTGSMQDPCNQLDTLPAVQSLHSGQQSTRARSVRTSLSVLSVRRSQTSSALGSVHGTASSRVSHVQASTHSAECSSSLGIASLAHKPKTSALLQSMGIEKLMRSNYSFHHHGTSSTLANGRRDSRESSNPISPFLAQATATAASSQLAQLQAGQTIAATSRMSSLICRAGTPAAGALDHLDELLLSHDGSNLKKAILMTTERGGAPSLPPSSAQVQQVDIGRSHHSEWSTSPRVEGGVPAVLESPAAAPHTAEAAAAAGQLCPAPQQEQKCGSDGVAQAPWGGGAQAQPLGCEKIPQQFRTLVYDVTVRPITCP